MYKEKITIQKRQAISFEGELLESWNDYYICRVEVLDLLGKEKYEAYNSKLENSIKFKCKSCRLVREILLNTKDYRVLWRGNEFKIIFIDTMNYTKDFIIQVMKVD